MSKLLMNRAQCRNCKDIIESKHVHDFVVCKCYAMTFDMDYNEYNYSACRVKQRHGIFIDGGLEYQRAGWYIKEDFIDLSVWEEDESRN